MVSLKKSPFEPKLLFFSDQSCFCNSKMTNFGGLGTLVKFTLWKVTWWSHNSLGDIKITWWIEIWHREIISHFVKSFLISWNQFLLGEKIFHIVKLSFTWWNENKRIILYDPEDHIIGSYYLILIRIWCAHFFLDGTLSSDFMDGRTAPGGQ